MRITVKVGTSTLAYPTGRLNVRHMEALCRTLSDIKNAGHEVILVSSGAIAMGMGKMFLPERPTDMPTKQAAAAVGQCELMYTYDQYFSRYSHTIGQILVTGSDMQSEERYANFRNTLLRMLELNILPIINENDTVATEEIRVGDNDTLGAMVAVSADADMLIILSDIEGLYTANPRVDPTAELIPVVEEITDHIRSIAGGSGSALGTGGMSTKINAAEMCMQHGADMMIVSGDDPEILYDVIEGKHVGTRFVGRKTR